MRLDKFLSNATDYSRSQIKKLLRSQCVTLNGDIESSAATVVNADDLVELEGVAIALPLPRYLMFNKPKGVVSATKDSDHPTAIDYLDEHRPEDLQIAGRLDIDATGLLLITDDGAWNHRVTSPNYRHDKQYRVTLATPVNEGEQHKWQEKFQQGVWLDGEKRRTLPAKILFDSESTATLSICEGKYHQVKRMCAAMGNHVIELHRSAIGPVQLDEQLQPGEYRHLSEPEVEAF